MGLIPLDDDEFYLNAQMCAPLMLKYACNTSFTIGFVEVPKYFNLSQYYKRLPATSSVVEYNGKVYAPLLYNYECDVFLISSNVVSFKEVDEMGVDADLYRKKCDLEIYDEKDIGIRWFRDPLIVRHNQRIINPSFKPIVHSFEFRKENRSGRYTSRGYYEDNYPHSLMDEEWYTTRTGRGCVINEF